MQLFKDLIKPVIDALMNSTSRGKDKRNNILNILSNLESVVFDGLYFHYPDKPSESEESVAERTKLRRQRSDKIAKKEKMISSKSSEKYFAYSIPSDMYKNLNKTRTLEENKARVNEIENRLTTLIKMLKSNPTSNAKTIKNKNRNNILEIVELILYFNQLNQSGQGLKILKRNQMLSRLPITLTQSNAGNDSEKLKNEIRQLLYSLYRTKKINHKNL